MRCDELPRRDSTQGRQVERQAEPGDDLGQPSQRIRPDAPHHLQGIALVGQVRTAADRADDQPRQEQRCVQIFALHLEAQHSNGRLVHTSDVLSRGREHSGQGVCDIDVVPHATGQERSRQDRPMSVDQFGRRGL